MIVVPQQDGDGKTNITSDAVRFTLSLGLREKKVHEASQVNAFRHTVWQAMIASRFDGEIAKTFGDLHKEEDTIALDAITDLAERVSDGPLGLHNADPAPSSEVARS